MQNLILKDDSKLYEIWSTPSNPDVNIPIYTQVFIFNSISIQIWLISLI